MDEKEQELWLHLIRAQARSPRRLARLLRAHWPGCSPADLSGVQLYRLLELVLDEVSGRGRKDTAAAVRHDLAWLNGAADRYLLPLCDPLYPPLLRQISDPPPALLVRGDPRYLGGTCLAIVGARHPTPQGRETARSFARTLAGRGLIVVSGLARGIDGCAHAGALETGVTVAICANGLDMVYPRAHQALAGRIAEGGALVSEFPPGTPPRAGQFPRRNRLISGMSLGTVVVEAGLRSGSLITARLAAEQNREVFAVPGSIHSPQSKGCHTLLKEGATLAESVEDILPEIGPFTDASPQLSPVLESARGNAEHAWFLEHMGYTPCTRDELANRSGLTSAEVSSMLLTLELEGCVELCPGGAYVRVNRS